MRIFLQCTYKEAYKKAEKKEASCEVSLNGCISLFIILPVNFTRVNTAHIAPQLCTSTENKVKLDGLCEDASKGEQTASSFYVKLPLF